MGNDPSPGAIRLLYSISDAPPIHLCIFLGLQQFLTMLGGTIATPFIVAEATCVGPDLVGRAQIMGTLMFVAGLCTLLQTSFGARLPIIQGASFGFVAPMMAMRNMPEFACPDFSNPNSTILVGSDEHRALWMSRLVEVQGAIMIAGALEAILGALGVVGLLLRAIGPLTIAPTIGLVGLSFADQIISNYAAKFWPAAILSLALVILFSLYLCNVPLPVPSLSFENRRLHCGIVWFRFFGLFPVLLAMVLTWALFVLLTELSVLPKSPEGYGYLARTDIHLSEFAAAGWFRFPYPGQWGQPRLSLAIVLGMCAGVVASVIETIGDLCACARLCGVRPPPEHAINRGIFAEGLGCILAGAIGCGPGVTSYSENIGAIAITRVASRPVFYVAACILIVFGCITKIAAFFALVPDPILGGVLIAMLSMVSAVGFSNLQFLDMNSTRNLLIFGLSMFLGISMPMWIRENQDMIKTGVDVVDQALIILLSTGMLVGGLIGFCLDNTVPGATPEQRGLRAFSLGAGQTGATEDDDDDCYDVLFFGKWIRKLRCARFVPISPSFNAALWSRKATKRVEPSHLEGNNIEDVTPI